MLRLIRSRAGKWLTALGDTALWRAALTADIINWQVKKPVCSICGAKSARSLRFSKDSGGIFAHTTIRLCKACLEARRLNEIGLSVPKEKTVRHHGVGRLPSVPAMR